MNGLDVVLVEKQYHPRPKPCGGALGPKAIDVLDFDYSHLIQREYHAAKIFRPSGKCSILTRDGLKGHLIRRDEFDSFLIDKAREAGAEIVQGDEIVAIEQLRKGVRALGIGDSYKAHLLVGADGVNGVSMKQLDIRHRWGVEDVAVCITAEVQVDPSEIERTMAMDAESTQFFLELYYGLVEWGYGWCFPKRESLNIGIGCRLDKAKGLRDKWVQFLSKISIEKGIKIDAIEHSSARVPMCGTPCRLLGRRSMLIGDAAGLVSTVSGEGISFALESGILAAEVATEAVRDESPVHIAEYDRRLKSTLLEELKDLHTLAGIMYKSESNLEMLCDILDNDAIMREYLSDIFARITPYSKLKFKIIKRLLTKHPRKAIKLGF